MSRDLEEDLKICEGATQGPWIEFGQEIWCLGTSYHSKTDPHRWVCDVIGDTNRKFIAEAREGWAHAIKRAQKAEGQVDTLIHEMRMLQDDLNQRRRQA